MIEANETFDATWPYAPNFFEGTGFRMHYIDEGPRDSEPIVCLHGEPTWGYLYRNFIPRLVKHGRVIVPDHMGFGKSETPQDRDYSIREHADNLTALMLHLDLRDITFVVHDWGGPIGGAFVFRNPERVKRLCILNTGVAGQAPHLAFQVFETPWYKWIHSGSSRDVLGKLGSTILSVMKSIGFEGAAQVDETLVRAYAAPFPDEAACKGAIQFPFNIASKETIEFLIEGATLPGAQDAIKALSAMYVHGEVDHALPMEYAVACFRNAWPKGSVVTLPGVGHFLQEDSPEVVIALIEQFIQMT